MHKLSVDNHLNTRIAHLYGRPLVNMHDTSQYTQEKIKYCHHNMQTPHICCAKDVHAHVWAVVVLKDVRTSLCKFSRFPQCFCQHICHAQMTNNLPGSAIAVPERSLRLPAAACSLVRRGGGSSGA